MILEQKKLVQEKQKEIIDSITYAKRIQEAILPPENYWHKNLRESFILYKPKDIVAGDFYWMEKSQDDKIIFLRRLIAPGMAFLGLWSQWFVTML